jgi:ketosteroid isomerase-like protein
MDRWNAGDHSVPRDDLDPDVELESPLSSVAGEPYRGHAGIEQWIRDLDEQFAEWHNRTDDVREVGNAVIAIGVISLRGRGSGVAFDQPMAWVFDFGTDGRITRGRIYLDVHAALEAVGLEG